jgi:tRNA wybutosine-synthesizing protein 3
MTHLLFNDSNEPLTSPAVPAGDVDLSVLPSFPQVRQQNLMTLYGNGSNDKSRAGHVDEHIKDLVDCINRHSSYVTLSSCSGRIALFDPKFSSIGDNKVPLHAAEVRSEETLETTTEKSSGKGGGAWLLVSHDAIDPESDLLPFFPSPDISCPSTQGISSTIDDQESICFLKLEPMLLHVAACNLYYGKLLLQLALQQGFRESGLIVTDQRVTIAIRTNGLSLSIPLSRTFNHPLRPTSSYLEAVAMECNRRLQSNRQSLNKLHMSIQQKLFQSNIETSTLPASKVAVRAASQLPPLNLFGHSMVAIKYRLSQDCINRTIVIEGFTSDTSPVPDDTELLVFGGYGPGPHILTTAASSTKPSSQRSSNVYRLCRDRCLEWSAHWDKVETVISANGSIISLNLYSVGCIQAQPAHWDARQSATAFNLSEILFRDDCVTYSGDSIKTLILIYGGRSGPARPIGDLLIYEYSYTCPSNVSTPDISAGQVFHPLDVRGVMPSPRWGHSLTPFNLKCSMWQHDTPQPIAILIGGRHTDGMCMDALFILSLVPSDSTAKGFLGGERKIEYHFQWERLCDDDNIGTAMQRFHHTANWIDDGHIFVFGGLFRPDDLLSVFSLEGNNQQFHNGDMNSAVMLTLNKIDDRRFMGATVEAIDSTLTPHRFGHTSSRLLSNRLIARKENEPPSSTVLLVGGVVSNTSNANDPPLMECVELSFGSTSGRWRTDRRDLSWEVKSPTFPASIDFGVMVHHCCMELSTATAEMGSSGLRCATRPIVVTGGGVSGFAFRELYANSYSLSIDMDSTIQAFTGDAASKNIGNDLCSMRLSTPSAERSTGMSSSKVSHVSTSLPQRCDVVYVLKRHAKHLKTTLEQLQILNKEYRLSEIDADGVIQWFQPAKEIVTTDNNDEAEIKNSMAVPVVAGGLDHILMIVTRKHGLDESLPMTGDDVHGWKGTIRGYGNQVCLWSTSAFARGGSK